MKALAVVTLFACLLTLALSSRVIELSDRFLDIRRDGQWLIMFYAPWCAHCKRLEPIWAHVAQALTNTNVRVGKVDCTRFTSLATEFKVSGFPTIMFLKGDAEFTYNGDRTKDEIMKFALRVSGPPVQSIQRPESLDNLKRTQDHFFVYVGAQNGPAWEAYFDVAEKFQPHAFFYATSSNIAKMHVKIDKTPSIFVYKDKSHFFYEDIQVIEAPALNTSIADWINQERFAQFPKVTRGNLNQLMKTRKFLVLAVVEENKLEEVPAHMLEFRDMVESVIIKHRVKYHRYFQFGWVAQPDLANSIAMQRLSLPSLMIVNSTTNHHHFPEDDPTQLTAEAIVLFLEQALTQALPVYGGNSWAVRVYRAYFELISAATDMWRGNPVLTTVLFGLPFGFLCLICYSICCADILDAEDEEEEEEELLHEKKE